MIPIYDTLTIYKDSIHYKDSLILSIDERSDRLDINPDRRFAVFQYEQTKKLYPKELFYKKGRLYVIVDGKRKKRKITNGYYIYPFVPWYIKQK
jgi:hypothetical protein